MMNVIWTILAVMAIWLVVSIILGGAVGYILNRMNEVDQHLTRGQRRKMRLRDLD